MQESNSNLGVNVTTDIKISILTPLTLLFGILVYFVFVLLLNFLPWGISSNVILSVIDPVLTLGTIFLILWIFPLFTDGFDFKNLNLKKFQLSYRGLFDTGHVSKLYLYLVIFKFIIFGLYFFFYLYIPGQNIPTIYFILEFIVFNIPIFLLFFILFSGKFQVINKYLNSFRKKVSSFLTTIVLIHAILALANCNPFQKQRNKMNDQLVFLVGGFLIMDQTPTGMDLILESIKMPDGTTITLNETERNLVRESILPGYEIQYRVIGTYQSGRRAEIGLIASWISSDQKIISISSLGRAIALKDGSATVIASWGGFSKSSSLVISPTPNQESEINYSSTFLIYPSNPILPLKNSSGKSGSIKLYAKELSFNANMSDSYLRWESKNPEIASISNSGEVVANQEGRALIVLTNTANEYTVNTVVTIKNNFLPGEDPSTSLTETHFQAKLPLNKKLDIPSDCKFGEKCYYRDTVGSPEEWKDYKHTGVDYTARKNPDHDYVYNTNYGLYKNTFFPDNLNMGNRTLIAHLLKNTEVWYSHYLHMDTPSEILNKTYPNDSRMVKNSKLGEIGCTGKNETKNETPCTYGTANKHLHFEMKKKGISDGSEFTGNNSEGWPCGYTYKIDKNDSRRFSCESKLSRMEVDSYLLDPEKSYGNNQFQVIVPLFSKTNGKPSVDDYDVFAVSGEPLYGGYVISTTIRRSFDSLGIQNFQTNQNVNYSDSIGEQYVEFKKSKMNTTINEDDTFFATIVYENKDAWGYPVKFATVPNKDSFIVDDNSIMGYTESVNEYQKVPGYFLGAKLTSERSSWFQWRKPMTEGMYKIYVHVPSFATGENIYYKIYKNNKGEFYCSERLTQNNENQNKWVELKISGSIKTGNDSCDNTSNGSDRAHLESSGFVGLSLSGTTGDVGVDAIKFIYTGFPCSTENYTKNLPVCSISNICSEGQHLESGVCLNDQISCNVDNGSGIKSWNPSTSSWNSCMVSTCDSGYHSSNNTCVKDSLSCGISEHEENGSCISNTNSCSISNGTGQQTWANGAWGICQVVSCNSGYQISGNSCITQTPICNPGYHLENSSCMTDTKSCSITNGLGQQTWVNGSWGTCQVVSCNYGYEISSNQCILKTITCPSGQHVENNQCVSNTKSCAVSNGTGHQTWANGSWGTCIVQTCTIGYKISNNQCIVDSSYCTPIGKSENQTCNIPNGWGIQLRTCSSSNQWGNWGTCNVASCNSGFYQSGNSCVQDCQPGGSKSQSCSIVNGYGSQSATCQYNGMWGSWSSCSPSSCYTGYYICGSSCCSSGPQMEDLTPYKPVWGYNSSTYKCSLIIDTSINNTGIIYTVTNSNTNNTTGCSKGGNFPNSGRANVYNSQGTLIMSEFYYSYRSEVKIYLSQNSVGTTNYRIELVPDNGDPKSSNINPNNTGTWITIKRNY
ncbi:MAG: hypothetical protein KDK54_19025 [Leptospiraceae bacterium]|nr:hypothetical protein [Leptospiraceae bacterium]